MSAPFLEGALRCSISVPLLHVSIRPFSYSRALNADATQRTHSMKSDMEAVEKQAFNKFNTTKASFEATAEQLKDDEEFKDSEKVSSTLCFCHSLGSAKAPHQTYIG